MPDLPVHDERDLFVTPVAFMVIPCFSADGDIPWAQEMALTMTWNLMRKQRALHRIFWSLPDPSRFSLSYFLKHFHPKQSHRFAYLVYNQEEIAGLFWVENAVPGYRAEVGGWSRRKYWGAGSEQMTELALDTLHASIPHLYMVTPHQAMVNLLHRVGLPLVTRLPGYYLPHQTISIFKSRQPEDPITADPDETLVDEAET